MEKENPLPRPPQRNHIKINITNDFCAPAMVTGAQSEMESCIHPLCKLHLRYSTQDGIRTVSSFVFFLHS